ncbi:protein of unknown function [Methylocella tundrae]|uniref:Uncharacterized protein n=1 Tax=Methylocella tundrae TaxID=227605 RepID=A0A4U8YYE0_METTU|nr:protein of unknown function [Methylocella tundrae]
MGKGDYGVAHRRIVHRAHRPKATVALGRQTPLTVAAPSETLYPNRSLHQQCDSVFDGRSPPIYTASALSRPHLNPHKRH